MFHRVPRVRAISKVWSTGNIHQLRGAGQITPDDSRKLLKSAIRLQCKIEPNVGVDKIFMNVTAFQAPQLGDIQTLFPNFVFFFNTRHPVPSLKSLKKVIGPVKKDLYTMLSIRWREEAKMKFALSYNSSNPMASGYSKWIQNVDDDVWGIIMYCMTSLAYFESKDMFRKVVLYERLVEDPQGELQEMFDILDISYKHVPMALEALKKDSQNGTWGARGGGLSLDPEFLLTFNNYMDKLGLPVRHETSEKEYMTIFGQ